MEQDICRDQENGLLAIANDQGFVVTVVTLLAYGCPVQAIVSLVRHGRALARQIPTLYDGMYLVDTVYDFRWR